jgi:hypothetical protein
VRRIDGAALAGLVRLLERFDDLLGDRDHLVHRDRPALQARRQARKGEMPSKR